MPAPIALALCIFFIIGVYRLDFKRKPDVSAALWIPLAWLILVGSRSIPQWLSSLGILQIEGDNLSGNPLDQVIVAIFMTAGLVILVRRGLWGSKVPRRNRWIFAWFLFCGLSILWSDYPEASLRKWIKEIGTLIMALVVVSEPHPDEAIKTLFKRCAYVLIPLSIVLIKYYPNIGIGWTAWGGEDIHGAAIGKNQLGRLCLICSFIFLWNVVTTWSYRRRLANMRELLVSVFFLVITLWLLKKSNCATSLVVFIIGVCVFAELGLPIVKKNRKGAEIVLILSLLILLGLEELLSGSQFFVTSLGRDMTFTERTYLWKDLLSMKTNPLLGTGYDSFWLGQRQAMIASREGWIPNEAHNGYLEVYLQLGLVGLFMMAGVLTSAYRKIRKVMTFDFDYGRVRLSLLIMFLLYNITESSVKGDHLMWFVFLLTALDCLWQSSKKRVEQEPLP